MSAQATAPGHEAGLILVLNCGSSSLKAALFDPSPSVLAQAREPVWRGQANELHGPGGPAWRESGGAAEVPVPKGAPTPQAALLAHVHARALAHLAGRPLRAAVHRVVHGGGRYVEPVWVDPAVLADLKSYVPLAPLHQPFAVEAIEALQAAAPDLRQAACFDTAFHHALPTVEQMLPLPYSAWERGLRRYGFHGLSYEFMAQVLPEHHGELARGRTIVAHLGSGASLCALQELRSQATTMGFSALDGLMMGTRCGSLDVGAVLYLMETEHLTPAQLSHLLYAESGLLGLSGVSSDPRALLPQEADNPRVQAALALYVRRIVREIGALTAVLGGLDLLVFTAGIGEHNAVIRERVCRDLGFIGVELDPAANLAHARVISRPSSRTRVAVELTNEEWVAAQHVTRLLAAA
ncbi:MAG: acetate/propionate family kinase [Pseudomonadota bacterium]